MSTYIVMLLLWCSGFACGLVATIALVAWLAPHEEPEPVDDEHVRLPWTAERW